MTLPDVDHVIIEEVKVVDYLLDAAHPGNGGKAAFFAKWGFTAANWSALAQASRDMVRRKRWCVAYNHRGVRSSWLTERSMRQAA